MITIWKDDVGSFAEVQLEDGDTLFISIAYMHSEVDFLIVEVDDSYDVPAPGMYTVDIESGEILRKTEDEDIDFLLERIHG